MTVKKGFSLVEVYLVTAISLLIFVAVVATSSIAVNRQKYDDSVTSFKDFLQSQYSEVQNVALENYQNPSERHLDGCTAMGDDRRGISDCYVVGRKLSFSQESNGTTIKVQQVIYRTANTSATEQLEYNDFLLSEADLSNSSFVNAFRLRDVNTYKFEWGGFATDVHGHKINNKVVLIFRSPATNSIRTYVSDDNSSGVVGLLQKDNLKNNLDICVNPDGSAYGPILAVRVNGGASNASGIELMPPISEVGGVKAVKCQRK